jgi:predicted DNA-binding helix-hairpin-helix protein
MQAFPIDINNADLLLILRVPGIGLLSAQKIVAARKFAKLGWDQLKKIGVAVNRARYFITCKSNEFERRDLTGQNIKQFIMAQSQSKYIRNTQTQLNLF